MFRVVSQKKYCLICVHQAQMKKCGFGPKSEFLNCEHPIFLPKIGYRARARQISKKNILK